MIAKKTIEESIKRRIEKQYKKMSNFREKLNLKTHPLKTLKEWAALIVIEKNGHCPCDPTRPACPCPQAVKEIQQNGKCYCGKFFTPEKWEEVWGWTKNNPNFKLEEWNAK